MPHHRPRQSSSSLLPFPQRDSPAAGRGLARAPRRTDSARSLRPSAGQLFSEQQLVHWEVTRLCRRAQRWEWFEELTQAGWVGALEARGADVRVQRIAIRRQLIDELRVQTHAKRHAPAPKCVPLGDVHDALIEHYGPEAEAALLEKTERLSLRATQILAYMSAGVPVSVFARWLGITPGCVWAHCYRLRRALH